MAISMRALNRATLERQLLLRRASLDVATAARRIVALQAQSPASPYLALWSRLTNFDPAELDAAFAGSTIVKCHLMRLTLHAVHASDYRAFREAMEPTTRASRLGDDRFGASGLTLAGADALLPEMLAWMSQPRSAAECEAWLTERLGEKPKVAGAWWGLRQYAPLWHVPTRGPWSFSAPRHTYRAAGARPELANPDVAAEMMRILTRRYLEGFGPASAPDVAQFAMVQRSRANEALAALLTSGEIERLDGPGGGALYDLPGAARPPEETPAPPRFLAMWDSVLLAYADRSRIIPPAYRQTIIRMNGDTLPTLLVDGYVAGVWRAVSGGIEATAFHPLPEDVWDGLAKEARSLLTLLAGRDARVYSRYDHWWSKLSGAQTRLLGCD